MKTVSIYTGPFNHAGWLSPLFQRTKAPSGLHFVQAVINLQSGFAGPNPTELDSMTICLCCSDIAYGIFRAADAPGLLCSQANSFGF